MGRAIGQRWQFRQAQFRFRRSGREIQKGSGSGLAFIEMKSGLCPSVFRSWRLRTIVYGARIGIILHCVSGCCKTVRIASRSASEMTIGRLGGWIRLLSHGFGVAATQRIISLCVSALLSLAAVSDGLAIVRCAQLGPQLLEGPSTDRSRIGQLPTKLLLTNLAKYIFLW